jgi:signal transduction histidine kinase
VIVNLVSNALKYLEPRCEVVVRATTTGHTAVISVADQGVGIPAEDQPRIFERYFRAQTGKMAEGLG